MNFGRTYNKSNNEVFVRDNEDGSIDVISNDWKEFRASIGKTCCKKNCMNIHFFCYPN